VVNAWNKLPQHVVDAPSVNSFKTGWTTSGKIWTLQDALLNKSIIVQVQVQVTDTDRTAYGSEAVDAYLAAGFTLILISNPNPNPV